MARLTISAAALLAVAAAPPPAAGLATAVPLDALQRCMTGQLAQTGRPTAINSAGGVVLDLAFPNVGTDGKVVTGHVAFAIDDLGTQRRVTATAADPGDAALAQQMLRDLGRACLPADDPH